MDDLPFSLVAFQSCGALRPSAMLSPIRMRGSSDDNGSLKYDLHIPTKSLEFSVAEL